MRRLTLDLLALLRSWRRSKLPVAAAILALALGFGAGGAVLTLVYDVVLTPPPYDEPEGLVYLESVADDRATDGRVSMADYLDWRERTQTFDDLAMFLEYSYTLLTDHGEPEDLHTTLASPSLFRALRQDAQIGRTFVAEEEIPGNDAVVLLAYDLWQRRFEGDPGVLGRELDLGGQSHLVVGVMPEGFAFPDRATELWSPMAFDGAIRDGLRRDRRVMRVLGRLSEGVSLEQARGDSQRLSQALADEHPDTNREWSIRLVPMREKHFAHYKALLGILLAASAAVLLIACLDVVHLLLARAEGRRLDLSIRQALGAGPFEETRLAALEGLTLAAVAAVPGLWLAEWGLRMLAQLASSDLPRFQEAHLGPLVGVVIVAAGLACGLLVGLLAAFEGWRRRRGHQSEAADGRAVGKPQRSWGGLLIASEVAVALMLLVGAGLLSRSFAQLEAVDPGFESEGVLAVQLFLPQARYQGPPQQAAFFRQLLEKLEAAPGVEKASLVSTFPLSPVGIELQATARAETGAAAPTGPGSDDPTLDQVPVRIASPGYYDTLGIPLLEGRDFDRRDHWQSTMVAVVNAELARRLWPDGTAVGQQLALELFQPRIVEVIGVVGNVRQDRLSAAATPEVYMPVEQFPLAGKALVLKSSLDSDRLLESAKAAIWAVDDQQPIYSAITADKLVEHSLGQQQFGRQGLGLLAALALVLTLVGIYAMAAQSVGQRTTEIGVRLSLGARPADLLKTLLRPLVRATFLGLACGLVAAVALTNILESLLYGVTRIDPLTFAAATLFLLVASLLGGLLPAWRALRLEPVSALQRS